MTKIFPLSSIFVLATE